MRRTLRHADTRYPRKEIDEDASPQNLRFRLVGDEPIATPDGRSIVAGWKVIVLKDTKSAQCYVTFITGSTMAATGPSVCP